MIVFLQADYNLFWDNWDIIDILLDVCGSRSTDPTNVNCFITMASLDCIVHCVLCLVGRPLTTTLLYALSDCRAVTFKNSENKWKCKRNQFLQMHNSRPPLRRQMSSRRASQNRRINGNEGVQMNLWCVFNNDVFMVSASFAVGEINKTAP